MELDAEKIERVTLIGLSWGGAIAQRVAARVPSRVRKLVLVDSSTDASSLEVLRAHPMPTLITWDEEDVVILVARAHSLGRALPHARLCLLTRAERDTDANPENRHWSQETHSHVWNRIVMEFLKE
jgi:pimeloyl-ACP methyl ester carboxylesterase